MTEHESERQAIRDAMARLLDGQPIRSDGKLTIKSLADEAGLKRWLLTHRHRKTSKTSSVPGSPDRAATQNRSGYSRRKSRTC